MPTCPYCPCQNCELRQDIATLRAMGKGKGTQFICKNCSCSAAPEH